MIHKYSMNGLFIVIDVNSGRCVKGKQKGYYLKVNRGAVHVVDKIVYDILDFYDKNSIDEIIEILKIKYTREEITEGYNEIKELEENQMLYTKDEYEDIIPQINKRNPVVKALCLHIAHDCNLKCRYCFASEGEYHGKRELMSFEVGKKAIDFLILASGKRKNLEVDFFGGEPLMNFDVVKEIVFYAREREKETGKNFRFTITTNGILLNDDIQNFINENMNNVVLSIDGRKEVNDKMRMRVGGQGSYDTIVPKFQKIADSRNQTDYYVRGTYTNLDFSNDVLHLANLGFKQISVEPVVADEEQSYSLKKEDLPKLFNEYEKLAEELSRRKNTEKDFNFFHFMIDLNGGPCIAKRLIGCGSGTEYLAVTPDGALYPCHQFAGMEEFKMGTVYNGIENVKLRQKFEDCNVYSKPKCRDCWAKFYCSGGCVANSYNINGDFVTPYEIGCELQRKRVECAIMLKACENFADR